MHGARYDGFQFAGWKPEDGWLQWNSCTTSSTYAPPNPQYYNWDGDTTQITVVGPQQFAAYLSPEIPYPCSYFQIVTISNFWMDIWELDPCWPGGCGGEDWVATAEFPTFNIVSSGGPYWYGESDWINPSSVSGVYGPPLTTQLKLIWEMSGP